MKIKRFIKNALFLSCLLFISSANAQTYISDEIMQSSGCTKQALEDMINAINQYRADSKNWNSNVTQPEFTLGGVSPDERGLLELPVNKDLMFSSNETARKFANGTYPEWDHNIDGQGATMRAIKNGWSPSMNKIFYANQFPVFTMLNENLYVGTSSYKWQDILRSWRYSPGHNSTLLSRGAVSIGCGCSDTKPDANGDVTSYWVLLIEAENAASESQDIMREYFRRGTFYRVKDTMKKADLEKYKANEIYEFIPEGLQKIRNEK